ncbi:MAG: LPS-assembly protein LptD [Saprospiraceae bacterium]|nr:LPS-assembly protein LptD [Saprospiraceae bacterium]
MFFNLICNCLYGQSDTIAIDTIPENQSVIQASEESMVDSVLALSQGGDSLNIEKRDTVRLDFVMADGAIDSEIDYGARDEELNDVDLNEVHLFGDAHVRYQNYSIKADYIVFNFSTNIASAFAVYDSTGENKVVPIFDDGNTKFEYDQLKFNFKTKKGIVLGAVTKEGEFYLLGTKTKFITTKEDSLADESQVIYNEKALVTTCNHKEPHFGIRAHKLKVIPNKLAVVGPSQLELAGVPTPLFLPFGFFPLSKGASSGLIIPTDFDYNPDLGFSFKDFGYYWPINEYIDLKMTGDYYTRGSWAARLESNYYKRYAFKGKIDLGYANTIRDNDQTGEVESAKSFNINITHNQDAKAHPYRSIGGSINISGNRYDQRKTNSSLNRLNNIYTSNFNYSNSLPGTPFSFRAGLSHSQNTLTRKVDITLPSASLNMNTIYPLKRSVQAGGERWYEKIALSYNASLQNMTTTTDTTIFSKETLDNIRTGLQQKASVNTSITAAKYFQISPSINYTENWYLNKEERNFDPTLIINKDSIDIDPEGQIIYRYDTIYGAVDVEKLKGFYTFRDYNFNVSLSTNVFGTKTFSKGWLRGIRHVMKPSISFTYAPDTKDRYELYVDSDSRDEFNQRSFYNPYRNNPFSPGLTNKQMTVSYRLGNIIEAKYFSKKDSSERKFKLLNSLDLNGNYNFAADSLKWSDISISGNTTIFKGLSTIRFTASYRPYVTNTDGKIVNKTIWDSKGKLAEFRNLTLNIDTRFTIKQLADWITGTKSKDDSKNKKKEKETKKAEVDKEDGFIRPRQSKTTYKERSFYSLIDNFSFTHTLQWTKQRMNDGRDTSFIRTHSIQLRGKIPLTDNWSVSLGNISYNFTSKTFPYPDFGIHRNLHCWEMSVHWNPSIKTYSFFIGVTSGALNFLKYEYGDRSSSSYFGG